MKQTINIKRTAIAAYAVTAVLFVIFSVYMFFCEKTVVFSSREYSTFKEITDYTVNEIAANDAPIGLKKQYSFKTDDIITGDASLMFYVAHSYVDVRLDDVLLYRTGGEKTNRIGSSPSSYWVVIPVSRLDKGKTVTVTVTPVYKSLKNRKINFVIGSKYAFFMKQLKSDLPQIVLSALCIIMGFLLVIVQLYLIFKKRTAVWNMFFLGNFSLLLGIWRITDTRFSALMFKNHTLPIGYITLSALFILSVPILLYADKQHGESRYPVLDIAAILTSAVAFVALFCQCFGIAELRRTLMACHVMIIIDIIVLISAAIFYNINGRKDFSAIVFTVLLISGGILDIVNFYLKGSSSGLVITLAAFLLYTAYQFLVSLLSINKKAYIDPKTGLFNRACWDDLVEMNISAENRIGMIMFDLNGLKRANDTKGHKIGDDMILNFSSILKKKIDANEFLCRWGGDEFAVFIKNAEREKTEGYISDVRAAVDEYNSSCAGPEINFACGYALSEDYPTHSWQELLEKADEYMYIDKKRWYSKNAVKTQH